MITHTKNKNKNKKPTTTNNKTTRINTKNCNLKYQIDPHKVKI